jgi:prepilin-type N-terminal cleavage/methylation domain-containing protein
MKKGFTLLELLIVVIIIGILAGLGIPQYMKAVERGRTAEAKAVLSQIRTAEEAYRAKYNTYTADLAVLDIEANMNTDGSCNANYWYGFQVTTATATAFTASATRCTAAGKEPQGSSAYYISLTQAGVWAGTAGYY